ncbi:histone-lysine N-methyltransferase SUVR4-like [Cornus florida]|uniref:histone-lysine N-methyltransferase SUVR4-like n=1 Tax=Cornus florida TaxID=4283 RepID=UPI00289CCB1A|nr:histone-lysine N-methyltransferase SUVR4-like [Cornus florida]
MKDICECFLAEGTHSTDEEHAGSITVTPSLDVSQKSNALVVLHGRGDREDNFFIPPSFLNGSVRSQNLIEVPPQFPGLVSLNGSNPIHCSTGSKTTGNPYCATEKKTKEQKGVGSSNSSAMVLFQKHHSSLDPLKHPQYLDDITRGEENVTISLINGITNDCLPTFYYIPRNIVYRNAYVKFILARISDENCCSNCFGDCMSLAIPCACAGETGGEFAYTPEGLVEEKFLEKCIAMNRDPQQHGLFYCKDCPLERSKDKSLSGPCKGHLVRKFIKECWYKCGCSIKCGNRVVQRGITVSMQVFMTPERKGWGLRTLEDLPKGAFICEYVGEIVTNMELYERNVHGSSNDKHTYPVLLDADWGSEGVLKDEEALCLDATSYGNVARFINHRCFDANLVEIPVEVETPDHHYYHLAFFTRRRVDAFEELTWDYGIDFNDHSHPVKAFQCQCGSKLCRGIKRQKRTKFSS